LLYTTVKLPISGLVFNDTHDKLEINFVCVVKFEYSLHKLSKKQGAWANKYTHTRARMCVCVCVCVCMCVYIYIERDREDLLLFCFVSSVASLVTKV